MAAAMQEAMHMEYMKVWRADREWGLSCIFIKTALKSLCMYMYCHVHVCHKHVHVHVPLHFLLLAETATNEVVTCTCTVCISSLFCIFKSSNHIHVLQSSTCTITGIVYAMQESK